MKLKFLALDLDGTLTNSEKNVTLRNARAVDLAMDKGLTIALVSGRPLIGITKIAHQLNMYDKGGYIIAFNGGQIIDCKSNELIYSNMLSMKHYETVCTVAREFGVQPLTYDDVGVVAESDTDYYVKEEARHCGISVRKVERLDEEIDYEVVQFMVVGEPEKISQVQKVLAEKLGEDANVFLSESYSIEVTAPGINKGEALKWLLPRLEIKQEEVCAFGDGLNDIEMISYAGTGIAMDNAYDDIKRVADHVTKSNDDDGVAVWLEKFLEGVE